MKTELSTQSIRQHLGIEGHMIIAGPCSAESHEQVMATARQLAATGKTHLFRAGIWKPRTRPNSFEGVGTQGLSWLQDVKKETGLAVTTEVANAQHVEQALKHDIDVLWIGARTTVNPFSVQEIADALKGIDIPVMVKNPINPDLALWLGALERLNQAGIKHLAAIHRGISSAEPSPFRNQPNWEMGIKLKTIVPDLEVICDPSHIAGARELIPFISQKAIDLDMDGLMIETHVNPDTALSDARQQVKPNALEQILSELVYRRPETNNVAFNDTLEKMREQIDQIDDDIIQQLSARMQLSEQIGIHKRENEITVFQPNRWNRILEERTRLGKTLGLSPVFIERILDAVHGESIRRQNEVMIKREHEAPQK